MSTALITADQFSKQWPVLSPQSEAAQLIRSNLSGEDVGIGDLDRIKVPAGGATTWTVPSIEGDKSEKVLEGIIIHVARRRAYWESANPSGDPPTCSSTDCITGIGDPGGDCESCPFNQFGSAVKQCGGAGRGKACKESTLLFLLRSGHNLPEVVVTPPGSLKSVKQYRLKLPVPYYACVTRLSLKKSQNKDNIAFAEIVPEYAGPLDPTMADFVKRYAQALTGVFKSATADHSDMEGDED